MPYNFASAPFLEGEFKMLVPIDKATGKKKEKLTAAEKKDQSDRKHAAEVQAAARKKK